MSLLCEFFRLGSIRILRFLAASDEEENQRNSYLLKVDPITRPIIDAQLTDTVAYGLYVSEVTQRQAANADLYARPRLFVAELAQPVCEEVGLTDLDHVLTIVHG